MGDLEVDVPGLVKPGALTSGLQADSLRLSWPSPHGHKVVPEAPGILSSQLTHAEKGEGTFLQLLPLF